MAERTWERLLQRNAAFADGHKVSHLMSDVAPHFDHFQKAGGICCIITCSDARVDPAHIFGLKQGEALVIRNAGGVVSADAIRSLEVMGTLGPISLIIVLRHTDCGGLFTTDDQVRELLSARAPQHAHTIKDKVFGTFRSVGLDRSVRQQVDELKKWPFLPEYTRVAGYIYDVETGFVREIPETDETLAEAKV